MNSFDLELLVIAAMVIASLVLIAALARRFSAVRNKHYQDFLLRRRDNVNLGDLDVDRVEE